MQATGTIVSVNVSRETGTIKTPVALARLTRRGLAGDAHAGPWHRQVSLLARESVAVLEAESGRRFRPGAFAENLTTSGIALERVCPGDRLRIGRAEVEVTQIGKACHGTRCAIYRQIGQCVMPTHGVFARVLRGGDARPGDRIEHLGPAVRVLIITLSDRASAGEYEDRSGPAIRRRIEAHFRGSRWRPEFTARLIPDDAGKLRAAVRRAVAGGADVIFTSGGTGIGPRDVTPETIRAVLDREIPGVMEYIRVKYGRTKPSALLSRSVAGVIGSTLVYALPGSVRAVREYLAEILRSLEHAVLTVRGIDLHG
jgi:molybdenum cofactor synthesis domain-containing protein